MPSAIKRLGLLGLALFLLKGLIWLGFGVGAVIAAISQTPPH